jgi:hypothetical protein
MFSGLKEEKLRNLLILIINIAILIHFELEKIARIVQNIRENKGEWFGMICLLGAIRRL